MRIINRTERKTQEEKKKVYYAIWFEGNRPGEFEFLVHNQSHVSTSLKKVRVELESLITEYMQSCEPAYTREEALRGLGNPHIFKLTLEDVK